MVLRENHCERVTQFELPSEVEEKERKTFFLCLVTFWFSTLAMPFVPLGVLGHFKHLMMNGVLL